MGKVFEVGKQYECANMHMHPITVLSRTKRNITVFDGEETWSARSGIDNDGDEYVQRGNTRLVIHGIQTYSSAWEIKQQ